ncbi:Lysosomal protective protein [Nymphon striatum]|nr:Lysosomal protective protein [Nymphon striatum]
MRIQNSSHNMLALRIFLTLYVVTNYIQGYEQDEIKNLPGLSIQPNFRHYSGYLKGYFENNYLHYWFVESQNNASVDPVVLWMNGGPGCSSLTGLLTEHGPYLLQKDGKTLHYNENSWNKVANVLYLESPVGVGFSYNKNKSYQTDDDRTTFDNFFAVKSFFKKFPKFLKNEFYVTGESYGGMYVPLLTKIISQKAPEINLKGFAIGNGLLDDVMNEISVYFYYYNHGFIGEKYMEKITKFCCNSSYNMKDCSVKDELCVNQLANIDIGVVNMYNVYAKCYHSSNDTSFSMIEADATVLRHLRHGSVIPCIDTSYVNKYMNQPSVRSAIHIPNSLDVSWAVCSKEINFSYKRLYKSMKPQILYLVNKNVRGMIYNGDFDTACNFLGDEWFFDSLDLELKSMLKFYNYNNQVAGYTKAYESLRYVTVKGAGHMVPTDQPEIAFRIFNYFLKNKDL